MGDAKFKFGDRVRFNPWGVKGTVAVFDFGTGTVLNVAENHGMDVMIDGRWLYEVLWDGQ